MNTRDAINEILMNINEFPLDISDAVADVPSAVIIDKHLGLSRKKVLSNGWNFNRVKLDLVPNTNSQIPLPTTFLTLIGSTKDFVDRDHKLFDKVNNTYIFTTTQKVEVITDIIFDDIPYAVANYIIQHASVKAYIAIRGYNSDVDAMKKELQEAKIDAERNNARTLQGNVVANNTDLIDRTRTNLAGL